MRRIQAFGADKRDRLIVGFWLCRRDRLLNWCRGNCGRSWSHGGCRRHDGDNRRCWCGSGCNRNKRNRRRCHWCGCRSWCWHWNGYRRYGRSCRLNRLRSNRSRGRGCDNRSRCRLLGCRRRSCWLRRCNRSRRRRHRLGYCRCLCNLGSGCCRFWSRRSWRLRCDGRRSLLQPCRDGSCRLGLRRRCWLRRRYRLRCRGRSHGFRSLWLLRNLRCGRGLRLRGRSCVAAETTLQPCRCVFFFDLQRFVCDGVARCAILFALRDFNRRRSRLGSGGRGGDRQRRCGLHVFILL